MHGYMFWLDYSLSVATYLAYLPLLCIVVIVGPFLRRGRWPLAFIGLPLGLLVLYVSLVDGIALVRGTHPHW